MSSFTGSFGDDGFIGGGVGYDPRIASQRFDPSFSNFDADSVKDSAGDSSPVYTTSQSYAAGEDVFVTQPVPDTPSPPSIYSAGAGSGFSTFSPEQNGKGFDGGFGEPEGSVLPPPADMPAEEGFALREWRRQNAIRLEEKEKKEKEMLQEIIEEAEQYKAEFYRKRVLTIENKKASNREKEKLFLANREKFHAEAKQNYWRAIAELIPNEVPTIQKRGKKDQEKKPSVVVIQGPKPGKPTDLSRMRHILLKLKHNTPPHMKPKPPPPSPEPKKDAKTGTGGTSAGSSKPAAATSSEAVAAA